MFLNKIYNYLKDNQYNINISEHEIYINNYQKLKHISTTMIIITINNIDITITGSDFKVIKMENNELLIKGNIKSFEKES